MASTTSNCWQLKQPIPSTHPRGTRYGNPYIITGRARSSGGRQRHDRRKVRLCEQNVHGSVMIVSIASHLTLPRGSAHAYSDLDVLVVMGTRRALVVANFAISTSAIAGRL
ncbi:hypothetical protein RSOLAG1IB_11452 [Rhizoctonia solani AG-1 IB]|uniref:Uncharacterized protein n=1 Tax=Thanatephorus cucumeris (strain AG1-IB / isolate 7/3/14) TaxID=1108050 RepID=A0A0B7F6L6_THACB|nr:hypothetical protein RSOLAG1IB_11452 [Rhizoctonia solani AG-1 IB]